MSINSSFVTVDFQEGRMQSPLCSLLSYEVHLHFLSKFHIQTLILLVILCWACFKYVNSFLHQRRPKLNTTVQLQPHKCQTDGIALLGYYPECVFSFLRCKLETNLELILPSYSFLFSLIELTICINVQKYAFALAPITQWQHMNCLFSLNIFDLF